MRVNMSLLGLNRESASKQAARGKKNKQEDGEKEESVIVNQATAQDQNVEEKVTGG